MALWAKTLIINQGYRSVNIPRNSVSPITVHTAAQMLGQLMGTAIEVQILDDDCVNWLDFLSLYL